MRYHDFDGEHEVDEPLHRAVKALANDEQHRVALEFIIYTLGRRDLSSFVPGSPDTTAHLDGRRFVAELICRLIAEPVSHDEPVLPRPRTMTERVRRRMTQQT